MDTKVGELHGGCNDLRTGVCNCYDLPSYWKENVLCFSWCRLGVEILNTCVSAMGNHKYEVHGLPSQKCVMNNHTCMPHG